MARGLEQKFQTFVVKALRYGCPDCFVFHVPNGGRRSRFEGAIFKGMGTVAGVPDLVVLWKGGAGFLELKYGKGSLSESQREIHARLTGLGYPVAVVRTIEEVEAALISWGAPNRFSAGQDA